MKQARELLQRVGPYAAAFADARAAGLETHVIGTHISPLGVSVAGAIPLIDPPALALGGQAG